MHTSQLTSLSMTPIAALLVGLPVCANAQLGLDAKYVLRRSIEYHDPSGRWPTLARTLVIEETRSNGDNRTVHVSIDKPNERFVYERRDSSLHVKAVVDMMTCQGWLNGSTDFSPSDAERYGLTCPAIERRRNYYQYLYGLPMKLRDQGTVVKPEVVRTDFEGREVLRIDVTYEESVGTDSWHFYFDPATFRMVGYRFNHDEALNDGEYIALAEEYLLDDMRIPKVRTWFRNVDGQYMGTDTLVAHRRVTYQW